MKIVVTGAAGFLGSRVVERLRRDGHDVVAVDRAASGLDNAGVDPVIRIDLAHAELAEVFDGAAALVHLAGAFPVDAVSLDGAADDLDVAMRVLEHAARVGVRHALVLSTAMVYGAWPNNPIPLTEDAPVRPNPEFAFAVQRAELERRAFAWRAAFPGISLAVLRPTVIVAYTVYPWVVANDRIRALGWQPDNSNEEAFVAAHEAGPLGMLNARRRQQISLGIAGGLLAAIGGTIGWMLFRRRVRR